MKKYLSILILIRIVALAWSGTFVETMHRPDPSYETVAEFKQAVMDFAKKRYDNSKLSNEDKAKYLKTLDNVEKDQDIFCGITESDKVMLGYVENNTISYILFKSLSGQNGIKGIVEKAGVFLRRLTPQVIDEEYTDGPVYYGALIFNSQRVKELDVAVTTDDGVKRYQKIDPVIPEWAKPLSNESRAAAFNNIAEYREAILTYMKNQLLHGNLKTEDKENIEKAIEANKNNGLIYLDFAKKEVTFEKAQLGLGAVAGDTAYTVYVEDTAGICEQITPLYEKLSEYYFGKEGKGPAEHGRLTLNNDKIKSFGVWVRTEEAQQSGSIISQWKKLYTSDPMPEWAKPLAY